MAIFSATFLKQYLKDFDAGKVVDFYGRKEVLRRWIDSIESGRIDEEKEIAIKSTFVNDFFGKVLGYSYGNSNNWLLQQEQKSFTDGSRCDAAFGYFGMEAGKIGADVKMVAEFKGSTADLDAVQKERIVKISAVDQAFLYAAKTPGNCHWIVVCNVREIRFYHYSSQAVFQSYQLADLLSDDRLLEMIFLFQAESILTRDGSARTDKLYELSKKQETAVQINPTVHIVDELYTVMKKFDGLAFVDPVYLANLYPFNVLGQRVWHYERGVLHTTNPAIFQLLSGLVVLEEQVVLSKALQQQLSDAQVIDPFRKVEFVFKRLNQAIIYYLTAVEDLDQVRKRMKGTIGFSLNHSTGYSKDYGIIRSINVSKEVTCDCVSCLYRELDFKAIITKLNHTHAEQKDLEYTFGKYLLGVSSNNELYFELEALERRYKGLDAHIAQYLIVKMNLKNTAGKYFTDARQGPAIKSRLDNLDLDAVVAYEVDLFAGADLRRYLVQMKDGVLIERIRHEVTYSMKRAKEIMEINLRGDVIHAFDQVKSLDTYRWMLYRFTQADYIMTEHLSIVRSIHSEIFQGYIYSFLTPGVGVESFDEHMLIDAVLHVPYTTLAKMLENIPELRVDVDTRKVMLGKVSKMLRSHVKKGFGKVWEDPDMKALMLDFTAAMAHYDVFAAAFLVVGKMGCSDADIRAITRDVLDFLIADPDYYDQHMEGLAAMIEKHGKAFSAAGFLEVLEEIIPKLSTHKHKYDTVYNGICVSWCKHFLDEKISKEKLIRQAVVNHMGGSNPDYLRLSNLWFITSPDLQGLIIAEFDRFLSVNFNGSLYERLLHDQLLLVDHKDFFADYVKNQVAHNTPDGNFHSDGKVFMNPSIYNLAIVVHRFDVPLDHPAFLALKGLSPFQKWMINPLNFDYGNFDVAWLNQATSPVFLKRLKGKQEVISAVEKRLQKDYDPKLAERYFKYLV
jgi:hypothetical protein